MAKFWENKKVLVTGGAGFVGSFVVEELVAQGAKVTVPARDPKKISFLSSVQGKVSVLGGDLENASFCQTVAKNQDVAFHLAASVGGIGFNMVHHGSIFKENMLATINFLEACRLSRVERTLIVSSACVYPRHASTPAAEEEGFKDLPESTNEGYGWAKRMSEFLAQAYSGEYGMKVAIARPCNVYGPRDNFDPDKSHVIAALIERVCKKPDPFEVWGSGEQTRSFIYVEDLVKSLLAVAEKYAVGDPVNLSSDEEIKIKDLVYLILKITGHKPKVVFDTTRPDGYPRRLYDSSKAKKAFGFKAGTSLEEGLRKTIAWYQAQKS